MSGINKLKIQRRINITRTRYPVLDAERTFVGVKGISARTGGFISHSSDPVLPVEARRRSRRVVTLPKVDLPPLIDD